MGARHEDHLRARVSPKIPADCEPDIPPTVNAERRNPFCPRTERDSDFAYIASKLAGSEKPRWVSNLISSVVLRWGKKHLLRTRDVIAYTGMGLVWSRLFRGPDRRSSLGRKYIQISSSCVCQLNTRDNVGLQIQH